MNNEKISAPTTLTQVEEIFNEWDLDQALTQSSYTNSELVSSMGSDTITLSAWDNDYTLGSNVSITGIGVPWTNTVTGVGYDPTWNNHASAKIKLDGPEADIEINGESMIGMLRQIEQRLNILTPNPKLESEWEELRALGDQYRKLEAEIQAKMKTWEKLSKKY